MMAASFKLVRENIPFNSTTTQINGMIMNNLTCSTRYRFVSELLFC